MRTSPAGPIDFGAIDITFDAPSPRIAAVSASTLVAEARKTLDRLSNMAARPPCAAFLGERNAGKSTAANHLIGSGLLPTNVVVSTRYPTLVRYAPRASLNAVTCSGERIEIESEADVAGHQVVLLEVGLPAPRLNRLEVLDTPSDFDVTALARLPGLPAQIMPVWCTMATQAWKASERDRWSALAPAIRRHGVLAVTGIDRLDERAHREKLVRRLDDEAAPYFRSVAISDARAPGECGERALAIAVETLAASLFSRRRRTVARLSERIARLADIEGETDPLPAFLAADRSAPASAGLVG